MENSPDHPEIRSIERTGYPTWLQGEWTGEPDEDPEEDY